MAPQEFDWEVRPVGVKVAALMTTGIIRRRLKQLNGATRVMLPGRARVDLSALSAEFGAPFERGPDDLRDIPFHFGREARDSRPHEVRRAHFRRDRRCTFADARPISSPAPRR